MFNLVRLKFLCGPHKKTAKYAFSLSFLILLSVNILFTAHAFAQNTSTSENFPRNLTVGDFGGDVLSLQASLIAEGFLAISRPTGYFGDLTAAAVAEWQAAEGLPSTGYFGLLSRAEIAGNIPLTAPTITAQTPQPLPTPATSSTDYQRNLAVGDSGADVSDLQSMLISSGYLILSSPTGYFGNMTATALSKWQASEGLPDTGYFGSMSRNIISTLVLKNVPAEQATSSTQSTIPALISSLDLTPDVANAETPSNAIGGGDIGGGGGGGGGGSPAITAPAQPSQPPSKADTTPPTIPSGLTATILSSNQINLSWLPSTDNIDVAGYKIFRNGVQIATTTSTSYQNINLTASTQYTYMISSFDTAGNVSEKSNEVSATTKAVADTIAPSISIVSPVNDATVSSTITIVAHASDNVGVTSVQFILDNKDLASADTSAPYEISWNTISVATGVHTLSAVASDAAGNRQTAANVIVNVVRQIVKGSSPPAPSSSLNYNLGISDGGITYLGPSDMMAELQAIKALGIGWVRFDMDWSVIQATGSSSYNWTNYDQLVKDLNALGLKGLGILDYTPQWARLANCPGSNTCAPANASQFATFAAAVANRYSSQGMHTWEIWNEPNISEFWQPAPNANSYAVLLKDADIAIRAQDPSATIILGGLARADTYNGQIAPIDFLTDIYNAGDEPYFDAVGLHPYSYPQVPSYPSIENPWYQIANTTTSIRSIMIANGDSNKKIWLTEYGAPTEGPGALETSATDTIFQGNPDHVTEALQATMYSQAAFLKNGMPYTGPLFFYTYQDSGTSTDTIENFFGILRLNGTEKPAYSTLKTLANSDTAKLFFQ